MGRNADVATFAVRHDTAAHRTECSPDSAKRAPSTNEPSELCGRHRERRARGRTMSGASSHTFRLVRVKHGAMQDTAAVRNPRVFQITAVDACPKRPPERKPTFWCLHGALLCIHFYPPILTFFSNWQKPILSLFFFCNFLVQCGVVVDSATSQSSARIESKTKAHRAQTRSCTFSSSVEDQAALTPLELSRRDKNDTMDWKQCNDFIA